MKSKLNIFFVSPEVAPFAHVSELGVVSATLPKYLKGLGHDIRVMMPNYKSINERKYVLRDVIRLQDLEIKIGDKALKANGKSSFIPDSKVQIYFLDNKKYFDRAGLYTDGKGKRLGDNSERFLFFSKGCLETLKLLYWQPDIIHCNGWQTSLIPYLLKTSYAKDPFFKGTKTLLSVQDFSSASLFQADALEILGVKSVGDPEKDAVQFSKLGMEAADLLSIASKSYLDEIIGGQVSKNGLREALAPHRKNLITIPNAVDGNVWNPETDSLIDNYTSKDLAGKTSNKAKLLERFNLGGNSENPVLSMVGDLTHEKGFDLLLEALEELVKLNVHVVMVGSTTPESKKKVETLSKKNPGKIGVEQSGDPRLLHLAHAGSDFILIPSRAEPYGLNHLWGMTYGTIPIARNTGVLADTIKPFEAKSSQGQGFLFEKSNAKEFVKTIQSALKVYADKEVWNKVIQNAMKRDYSWNSAVPSCVKAYQKLMSTKR